MFGKNAQFFLLFATLTFGSFDAHASEASDSFWNFFKSVVRKFDDGHGALVERWPDQVKVCVFGEYADVEREATKTFISAMTDNTVLDFWTKYSDTAKNCDNDASLYIRFYGANEDVVNSLMADLNWIAPKHGTTTPISRTAFGQYGTAIARREPGKAPYGYVAAPRVEATDGEVDEKAFLRSLEKSLFRVFSFAGNSAIDEHTLTILNAPLVANVGAKNEGMEVSNMSRSNLCSYDVMLLLTLYAPAEAAVPKFYPFSSYRNAILSGFSSLQTTASTILGDVKYKSIFNEKCE